MSSLRTFVLAFAVGAAASFVPSCGQTGGTCTPSNCNGCCGGDGLCKSGATSAACGAHGSACVLCSASEVCQAGVCTVPGQGGDGGSDGGSCSSTCLSGCCAPNGTCITPSNTVAACGANGGLCQVCNGSQQCTSGQCVNPGCPGCVDGTGACQPGNTNAACGQGGNSCATCSGTAQCTNNQCVTPTCHGCVDGSGTCQPGNTNAACGANGIACQSCTGTAQCTNNQCITPTCNGCLDGNGVCQPGNTNAACGTAGEHCLVCTGQQQCNGSGQCIVPTCNGCVDGTGTCQPGNTNGACGLGGGSCTTCTAQHQCTNGVCVNTCTGCVDGTGTCQPGNTNGACGNLGAACTACTGNTTCVGGGCQVNSDGGTFTCTTTETYASCGGSCGVERWGAKVLTDAPSANVNMTPQLTTVAQLVTLPKVTPGSNDPRGGPNGTYTPEFNTYLIRNANMSIIKSESDLDYHLVLADPQSSGTTMIGEIPCPNCANGSKYQCFFTRARHALEAKFGAPPSISGTTPVSLIGAAFYDPPHGQTGAAPNNLEIHSIMAICFTTDCDPTAD